MVSFDKRSSVGTAALLLLLMSLLVIGAGLIAGQGDIRSATVAAGALFGMLLLTIPALALFGAVIGSLVVVGLAQLYFPELQFIRWSVPVIAAALVGMAIVSKLDLSRYPHEHYSASPMMWWMTAFVILGLVASALNQPTAAEFAFGFKGYFQFWGLYYSIVLMRWREESVDALPKIVVWVALFQLPFVLHQFFFLVPARIDLRGKVVAEDVVAGTLGASATGGGANASLSILLITAVAMLTALYRRGTISKARLAVASVLLLIPLFLNANRAAVGFLLVAYVMLFARDILRRPVRTLVIGALAASIVVGIAWTQANLLSRSEPGKALPDFVASTFKSNVSTDYGHGEYQLNRWTALTFWASEHRDAPVHSVLFGHGLGASRDAIGGALDVNTLAQWRYEGMGIGLTAASGVLWELGVTGFVCLVGVFWAAFHSARRLEALHADVQWRAAIFHGLQVAVAVFFLSLFHKNSFLMNLPFQALLATVLGYLAYWQARANQRPMHLK